MNLYIGIMSGTSMDGIDTVLVEFDNNTITVIDTHSQPFSESLKKELIQLLNYGETSLKKIGETDYQLGLCYAEAVNNLLEKSHIKPTQVKAIGCHGQTIFHSPETNFPFSMQLGDGNLIAAKTGIKTVADFRRMDMAYGGQGAPLVPAFHQGYFYNKNEKRVILNLGGIANITILSEKDENVLGFDTGPANCLMNGWIQKTKGETFDKNGAWAASGKVIGKLLDRMMTEPYFNQPAPKSTGRELFNLKWLDKMLAESEKTDATNVQATLLELTAVSITDSIKKHAPNTDALYVCGGGAYNLQLLNRLSFHLKDVKVSTTDELGLPAQQVEAVAFAWLAKQRINNLPGNLPSVTGASRKTLLGVIYEPAK